MPHFPKPSPGLSRFAAFTALATLGLIVMGGLVTSHGAGMAVPDWPTTYGYNMFLFPISEWKGGIFYEHTHRLWASGVGFLTILLAVGLQWRAADRRLARLGWIALVLVILQGVLGGLRVSLMKDQIGIVHAALAQGFLVLITWIAVASSRWWHRWTTRPTPIPVPAPLARWIGLTTLVIFTQLAVGATMRHQHAGLAVPDFPLAYGQFWPPTDDAFLQQVNARRTDARDFAAITRFQINVHMAHRCLAFAIVGLVLTATLGLRRLAGASALPGRLGTAWAAVVLLQVLLGALTVWSNKAADVATAHVFLGAIALGLGAVITAVCRVPVRQVGETSFGAESRLRGAGNVFSAGRTAVTVAGGTR